MTIEELKIKFDEATLKHFSTGATCDSISGYYSRIYAYMFGESPHVIDLSAEGFYLNPDVDDTNFIDDDDEETDDYIEEDPNNKEIYTFNSIFTQQTFINFVKVFKDKAYIIRQDEFPTLIMDKAIIFYNTNYRTIYVLQNQADLLPEIKDAVIDKDKVETDDNIFFSYITNNGQGFNETTLKIKRFDVALEDNYNDDLPDKEIKDFLKGTKSGLLLLHGVPGSGKSHYIRHLIRTITGRHFIVLDPSVFHYITDASFIDLLIQNKNAVIILEDCENMLTDRAVGNAQIASLLNLSDGIIGDSFNFKFICTFNANVTKIDKALLRRGRLYLKYEFKELTPEKTQKLAKKLGKQIPEESSLTVADIYNYGADTGVKAEKKVGFNK